MATRACPDPSAPAPPVRQSFHRGPGDRPRGAPETASHRHVEAAGQALRPAGPAHGFPSIASGAAAREMLRREMRSSGLRPYSAPLLLYRVYADAHEEPLCAGCASAICRSAPSATSWPPGMLRQFSITVENGAPMALTGAANFIVGCSAVAPAAVLFEELETGAAVRRERPVRHWCPFRPS